MVLVIDNYDSFTYNLVQYLGEMRVELQVHRNDQITLDQIQVLNPERILISPGPCSPRESGLSNEIIHTFGPHIPLFGVCLGLRLCRIRWLKGIRGDSGACGTSGYGLLHHTRRDR